jgi:hypothetical protein
MPSNYRICKMCGRYYEHCTCADEAWYRTHKTTDKTHEGCHPMMPCFTSQARDAMTGEAIGPNVYHACPNHQEA